jgi:hypothetical protein
MELIKEVQKGLLTIKRKITGSVKTTKKQPLEIYEKIRMG